MRCVINSTVEDVSKKERIGYRLLVSIMRLRINNAVDWEQYSVLHTIGIDEISSRKGHQHFRHGKGDHQIWYSPITEKKFSVPHPKKQMPIGTLKSIKRMAGV